MPICYHIELDITRNREGEEPYPTTYPVDIRAPDQMTPEELMEMSRQFWRDFLSFLGTTAPERQGEYSWGGIFRIVSIFNC